MRGRLARMGAMAALVVVSTTLVSCGGKSEQAQAQELILGASEATFAAGTAQVLIALGDTEAEGQVDFDEGQSQVTVDRPAGETTVWVDGADVLVGVRDIVALVDPDDLDPLGTLRQLLLTLSPTALVHLLDGLDPDDDVEIVGDDDVDGTDTTHYRLHIDVDHLLDQLDGDDRDLLQLLLDALGADGLDLDVWLDDDGRIVQMQYDVDTGDDEPLRITFGLRDFGSDVDIEIPDTEEALSPDDFQLATADISGRWSNVESTITSTTNETAQPSGPEDPGRLNIQCDASGSCTNRASGNAWVSSGSGVYTVDAEQQTDCTDNATGALVEANSATITYHSVWTVTDVDESGRAVAMTSTGTIEGEVTPQGRARNCPFVGGGFTFTAEREGSANR
jgi:hypothetical protein